MTSSSSFRFPRASRLLTAAAFGRVFKKATRSRDKLFTVLCRDSKDETARLGMAISKKHCRKATQRNRIKRVVRESFRKNQQQLASLDIVVINHPAAAMADNGTMNDSLEQHWQRCTKAKQKLTERDS